MRLCFITWVQSQKQQNDFVYFQGKLFNITLIQDCASKTNAEEVEVEELYEDLEDILKLTLPKDAFFIIGGWNAKVGSQEIPGVSVKFGLGVQNEAGQRLTVLPRERSSHTNNTSADSTHGHH